MPDTNTSLAKAANVGHLVILKDYADDTFATKEELQAVQQRMPIVSVPSGTTQLTVETDKYYSIAGSVGTLSVTLPDLSGTTKLQSVMLSFTAGSSPNVTFTAAGSAAISYFSGYAIEAGKNYELNLLFNGTKWIVAYGVYE